MLATIAFLFIVLNPRLYANSFFNTKDIPFLSMFFICFYLSAIAFSKNNMRHFVLLGIGAGLLINLRIMGVLFAGCVLLFLAIDSFWVKIDNKPSGPSKHRLALAFLGTTVITLYITWPFLWTNPIGHFIFAFKNMSNFRWDGFVLFKGASIASTDLPWDYIPTWFAITTPVAYMVIGFFGIALFFTHFFKDPRRFLSNTRDRNNLLFAICFFTPVAAVIILESVLYDDWRHMYFIYGAFVLLSLYGLNAWFKTRLKASVIVFLLLFFCSVGYFMVDQFPHQNVYFNSLVDRNSPDKLRRQFELDYWGTSYKHSLEYILKNDTSPSIHVAVHNKPGEINIAYLTAEQEKRIKLTDNIKNATYYITNHRRQAHDSLSEIEEKKYHSIKVGNNTINSVFKLK